MKVHIAKVTGSPGLWFVSDKYGFAVGCIEYREPLYVVSLLELPVFTTRTLEWACGYVHGYCREVPDRKEHGTNAANKQRVNHDRRGAVTAAVIRGQSNGAHDHNDHA